MTPINNNQMSEELIEIIKDDFTGCGVKQKSDGRIVTYFTPDSATELVEKLTKDISTLISHERAEAVRGFAKWLDTRIVNDEEWAKKRGFSVFNDYAKSNIKELKQDIEEYLSNESN